MGGTTANFQRTNPGVLRRLRSQRLCQSGFPGISRPTNVVRKIARHFAHDAGELYSEFDPAEHPACEKLKLRVEPGQMT
jgi:hypothetical protein